MADPKLIDLLFRDAVSKDFEHNIFEILKLQGLEATTARGSGGEYLLHYAAGFGRRKLLRQLISQQSEIDARDYKGKTPLHHACNHAHKSIVECLIEQGADVNAVDRYGWTPLHFALGRGCDSSGKVSDSYWKVVLLLLRHGADPTIKTSTGRDCFARIRDSDQKRIVLEMVTEFVDRFFESIKNGDEEFIMKLSSLTPSLLSAKLSSRDNITPLHRAAGYNHLNIAQMMIDKGAYVDATDDHGRIPLHNAAEYGHIKMIELLVSKGSDVNKQDFEGFAPIHKAAANKTSIACLTLIALGANISIRTNSGLLPLDLAESEDARQILNPPVSQAEIVHSSDRGIYIGRMQNDTDQAGEIRNASTMRDDLMIDSESKEPLFKSQKYTIKIIPLERSDPRYKLVEDRMQSTIVAHCSDSGGLYTRYDIIKIELILHKIVWQRYQLMCQRLKLKRDMDNGVNPTWKDLKNERLLFHGSKFIDVIKSGGFDEGYAQRDGMFGAGIYFAEHSSKSNQYTFGFGQGCEDHRDKSCYVCERRLILAQVALGRTLISKIARPELAHAPPGYSSVIGDPQVTENLLYPEYVIYSGDQAYPLFVITYRIAR